MSLNGFLAGISAVYPPIVWVTVHYSGSNILWVPALWLVYLAGLCGVLNYFTIRPLVGTGMTDPNADYIYVGLWICTVVSLAGAFLIIGRIFGVM